MSRSLNNITILITVIVAAFLVGRCSVDRSENGSDRIVTTDTVRVPIPEYVPIKSTEYVIVPIKRHSDPLLSDVKPSTDKEVTPVDVPVLKGDSIEIPIEYRKYTTDSYTATVRGWRPELVEIETYNKTIRVKPRFTVTGGVTLMTDGSRIYYGVGITAGLPLWSK